jgi:hypothetical protein
MALACAMESIVSLPSPPYPGGKVGSEEGISTLYCTLLLTGIECAMSGLPGSTTIAISPQRDNFSPPDWGGSPTCHALPRDDRLAM